MKINNLYFVSEEFISRKHSSFKSLVQVLMYDLSWLDSISLIDPFKSQNEWINLFTQSLKFSEKHFITFAQAVIYIHERFNTSWR